MAETGWAEEVDWATKVERSRSADSASVVREAKWARDRTGAAEVATRRPWRRRRQRERCVTRAARLRGRRIQPCPRRNRSRRRSTGRRRILRCRSDLQVQAQQAMRGALHAMGLTAQHLRMWDCPATAERTAQSVHEGVGNRSTEQERLQLCACI